MSPKTLRARRLIRLLSMPNPISIAGATVGMISMVALPWMANLTCLALIPKGISPEISRMFRWWLKPEWGFFDFMDHSFPLDFQPYLLIFLLGTLAAYFTPLGGVGQMIGVTGFLFRYISFSYVGVPPDYFVLDPGFHELGVGLYAAFVSASMVLVSCRAPEMAWTSVRGLRVLPRVAALSPRTLGLHGRS